MSASEVGTEVGTEIGPEIGRDIVDLDARAVQASVQIVSQASAADLAQPTPCPDWTLAELLAHMTVQHNGFAAAAAGDGADLDHWQTGAPVADPVGEYAAAAAAGDGGVCRGGRTGRGIRAPGDQPEAAVPRRRRRSAFTSSTTWCTAGTSPGRSDGRTTSSPTCSRRPCRSPRRCRTARDGGGPGQRSRPGSPRPAAARWARSSRCSADGPTGPGYPPRSPPGQATASAGWPRHPPHFPLDSDHRGPLRLSHER